MLLLSLWACGASGPGSAGSWREQGKRALKQGRLGLAAKAFQKDSKANPTDAEPHRWLARTHKRRGDFKAALGAWKRWLEAKPEDWTAWQQVGDLYFATGQYAAALNAFERVVASAIAAPIVIARMAEAEIQLRREGKARQRLETAIKEHPDAPALHRVHGRVLLALNHPHKAVVALKKASSLDPNDVEALFDMGQILEAVGFPKRARNAFELVLKRRPNHVGATVRLGRLLIQLGEPVDALIHLQKAVRMQPDDVSTQNSLGVAFNTAGMRPEAVAVFEKALATDSKQPAIHANMAEALYGMAAFKRSATHLRRALALDPKRASDRLALRRVVLMDEVSKTRCAASGEPSAKAIESRLKMRWRTEGWPAGTYKAPLSQVMSDREALLLLDQAVLRCRRPAKTGKPTT